MTSKYEIIPYFQAKQITITTLWNARSEIIHSNFNFNKLIYGSLMHQYHTIVFPSVAEYL